MRGWAWVWIVFAAGCATASVDGTKQPVPADRAVASGAKGRTAGPDRLLPDLSLTPGMVDPSCDETKVCQPGYSDGNAEKEGARNVDDSTKQEVYQRYGINNPVDDAYEIDHLISLEVCGSNDPRNLWPESYKPVPGAHEKDRLEDWLHEQVCKSKTMTLKEAQEYLVHDWYAEYQKMQEATGK